MKTKKPMKTIIESIKKAQFDLNFTTMEDSLLINKKIGGYVLEFVVKYNTIKKKYRYADYFQPEECDITFDPTKIEDVCVYVSNEIVDITENQLDSIKNTIEAKILN